MVICNKNKLLKLNDLYDYKIEIDHTIDDVFKVIFYQLFGQLIGFFQARKKGINPTDPKNLDYFVTF